jgi:hypothetical protein
LEFGRGANFSKGREDSFLKQTKLGFRKIMRITNGNR